MRSGTVSLIANKFSTEIHIISKSKIGQNPSIISPDWKVFGILRGRNPPIPPTSSEVLFAIWLNRQPEFTALPSEMEFQMRSMQSINSRDKFSLLRDVKADCFYDILGEVIKIIDQGPETVTIYLSDYTANSNFYQNVWGDSVEDGEGRDGDQYGYVKPKKKSIEDWPGPFGKLSIQLSIFDTHANFIRDSVKPGDWVLLCNVQMKFGRTGGLLEGFLRGDRGSYEGKIQVRLMLKSTNSEDYDPRWKEALRRKHEWSKKFNAQKEEFLNEALGKAKKRKYDEAPKPNSRGRRKKARKQGVTTSDAKLTQNSSLNQNSRFIFYADQQSANQLQ
jgi:protection-of-telomeres protein 1